MTFLTKFLSRKFIVAVGAVASLVSQHQYAAAAATATLYIAAQAHVDAKTVKAVADEARKQVDQLDDALSAVAVKP